MCSMSHNVNVLFYGDREKNLKATTVEDYKNCLCKRL